jgi:protein-S-isoprenylcysteine O-methyltransferase Ste14
VTAEERGTGGINHGPGVRFPPPLLFVAGLGLGAWLDRARPWPLPAMSSRAALVAGALMLACWLGLMLWAMLTFVRARTAIIPNRPATALVTGGPFRYTRNPMYLSLTLFYLGVTLLLGTVWPLLLLPVVLLVLHAAVIRREERHLDEAFGPAYAEYRARVRRWL